MKKILLIIIFVLTGCATYSSPKDAYNSVNCSYDRFKKQTYCRGGNLNVHSVSLGLYEDINARIGYS